MAERKLSPEEEARKEAWLKELAKFIVEANLRTWAADGPEVIPQRPGFKELEYPPGASPETAEWYYRDSYTGYFRAPGMTTVYYKGRPAWAQVYGGHGQIEGSYNVVKPTFDFLRKALKRVTPELPFRGPEEYKEGDFVYTFELEEDNIEDCTWNELITKNDWEIFSQVGSAGLIIHRDQNRQPIYPWNF